MSDITTVQFDETLMPGIRKAIDDGFREYSGTYKAIANVSTTDREFFDDIDFTGLGTFAVVPEGNVIPEDSPLQGYKTRYTIKDYAEIVPITHKLLRGDLYNVTTIPKMFKKLGRAANRTIDKNFWSMFNNGFSTSYTSYGDAKPLFSTVHPRKDGGTAQSNASATGATLTMNNLTTAKNALREVLDHKGQVVDIGEGRLTLIVPPALEDEAVVLTESKLEPGTADNDINYHYYKGNTNVLVCKWISAAAGGSDTAWFLVADGDHQLNLVTRESFQTKSWEDNETRTMKVRGSLAFAYGWSSWYGTWGSAGDGAAYSS